MKATIEVDFSAVNKFLSNTDRHMRFSRAGWKAAAAVYYGHLIDVFQRGGLPDKWKPLRPRTIAQRQKPRARSRRTGAMQILVDTGILRASLAGPGGRGAYYKSAAGYMEIGTKIRSAKYHQDSTANMTARPIFTTTPGLLKLMGREYIKTVLRQSQMT